MQNIAIYIGKFQLQHIAHEENIRHCLENYDHTIVLVGSVNRRESIIHPFSFPDIKNMIFNINKPVNMKSKSFTVKPIKDYMYNETKWITQVEEAVLSEFGRTNAIFTIVGHSKDETSYYLKEFPNFRQEELPNLYNNLSSTQLRKDYFINGKISTEFISPHVAAFLKNFKETENYQVLKKEAEFYKKESEMFANYPFPETLKFNCSDAIVECDGNILLIQRKIAPGENCWALPGGFVNQNETYREAAIRELREETGLRMSAKVIDANIRDSKIFDTPKRNIGIPRITNAFYIKIAPDNINGYSKLPKVKGADDAKKAQWVPLAEVKNMVLFDDHYDIINHFTQAF